MLVVVVFVVLFCIVLFSFVLFCFVFVIVAVVVVVVVDGPTYPPWCYRCLGNYSINQREEKVCPWGKKNPSHLPLSIIKWLIKEKLDCAGCIDGVPESLRRFSFSGCNAGATSGD